MDRKRDMASEDPQVEIQQCRHSRKACLRTGRRSTHLYLTRGWDSPLEKRTLWLRPVNSYESDTADPNGIRPNRAGPNGSRQIYGSRFARCIARIDEICDDFDSAWSSGQ